MGRQGFVSEEVRQMVRRFRNTGATVEIHFRGQYALSEGDHVIAGEAPAELGVQHVDNGGQGIRNIQNGKRGEQA